MVRLGFGTSLVLFLTCALLPPEVARAQGQAMPPIKVNLPPSPNFDIATAPVQYPSGELSIYGLRKGMSKYLDKDVRVKAYLVELYECPPEIRKCNEDAAKQAKRAKAKAAKAPEAEEAQTACRPCDQPHLFLADTMDGKRKRALLMADFPLKDWKTGKPKPLKVVPGQQYVVTGLFAINSITGFAASTGLLVHKKIEDLEGNVISEGNSVAPPEAQTIDLDAQRGAPPAK